MDRKEPNNLSSQDNEESLRKKIGFILKKLIDKILNEWNATTSTSVSSDISRCCSIGPLRSKIDILDMLIDLTCGMCETSDSECEICENQNESQTPSTTVKRSNNPLFLSHNKPKRKNPLSLEKKTATSDFSTKESNMATDEEQLHKITLKISNSSQNPQVTEKNEIPNNSSAITTSHKTSKSKRMSIQHRSVIKEEIKPEILDLIITTSQKLKNETKLQKGLISSEQSLDSMQQSGFMLFSEHELKQKTLDLLISVACELRVEFANKSERTDEGKKDVSQSDLLENELKSKILALVTEIANKFNLNEEELKDSSDNNVNFHVQHAESRQENLITPTTLPSVQEHSMEQNNLNFTSKNPNESTNSEEAYHISETLLNDLIDQLESNNSEEAAYHISEMLLNDLINRLELSDTSLHQHPTDDSIKKKIWDIVKNAVIQLTRIEEYKESISKAGSPFRVPNIFYIKDTICHVLDIIINTVHKIMNEGLFPDSESVICPFHETDCHNDPDLLKLYEEIRQDIILVVVLTSENLMQMIPIEETEENGIKIPPLSPLVRHSIEEELRKQILEFIIKVAEILKSEQTFLIDDATFITPDSESSSTLDSTQKHDLELKHNNTNMVVEILEDIIKQVEITDQKSERGSSTEILSNKPASEHSMSFNSDFPPRTSVQMDTTLITPSETSSSVLDSSEKHDLELKQTNNTVSPVAPEFNERKEDILNIVVEILEDIIKQIENSEQKSEKVSPIGLLSDSEHSMDFHSDFPPRTSVQMDISCDPYICALNDMQLNICDCEEEISEISDALETPQLSDTNKISSYLCKNSKPCASYAIAKFLESNLENIEELNQQQKITEKLEGKGEPSNSNINQQNRDTIYNDKLKQYIHQLVEMSMQELSQHSKDEQSGGKSCPKPCPAATHSDSDIQSLIIIIEAFLDKFITSSCECEFPLEKLCNLLRTITTAIENTSNEEFQEYFSDITKTGSSRKEANKTSPKSWILGQKFGVTSKERKQTDVIPDRIYKQYADGRREQNDLNVVDTIPVKCTKDSILQTESTYDFYERKKIFPCSQLMRGMTQQQFKQQLDLWFGEFKDFYQLFTRQSNFVIKNDFVLATNREKLESLNSIIAKSTASLEFIEKSLKESDELQCECLTIHSMYLSTDIKGKGERERMYSNLLQVKQSLDETSKLKDIINEHIKWKIDSSLITKVIRILSCFANTLQGVEYKIQVLEHELQAVKSLSAAVISRRL